MNIAIITGASSGIGREFVYQLDRSFVRIDEFWLIARRREKLEELAEKIRTKARIFCMDLLESEAMEEILACLKKEKPKVKFLINSAGIGLIGDIADYPYQDEASLIRLNISAPVVLTNICLPYMNRNSYIWMIASAAAFLPQPGFAIYAASKSFLLSYARALNREQKRRKVHVTAVCPGPVDTEFFDKLQSRHALPSYKKLFFAKTEDVVKRAIRDGIKKKEISVYGISIGIFRVLAKCLPHSILLTLLGEGRRLAVCRRK